jgi:hypothetical protein
MTSAIDVQWGTKLPLKCFRLDPKDVGKAASEVPANFTAKKDFVALSLRGPAVYAAVPLGNKKAEVFESIIQKGDILGAIKGALRQVVNFLQQQS